MRIYHRYLGFFLAGIMAMYAISGVVMIFRNTDHLKKITTITRDLKPNAQPDEIEKKISVRNEDDPDDKDEMINFNLEKYDPATGKATYVSKQLPELLEKMTKIHKAKSGEPLYMLNIFFGVSLLFFVISSFWMFAPRTAIFRKGLLYSLAGIILTIVLLLLK